MQARTAPREIPERPSRAARVVRCEAKPEAGEPEKVWLYLPREDRQMDLLGYMQARLPVRLVNGQPVVDNVELLRHLRVLAAMAGACWYHPQLDLETPVPWGQLRACDTEAERAEVLDEYGEAVLDELDDDGRATMVYLGPLFGALSAALARRFKISEEVEERVGFSEPDRAGSTA